MLTTQSEDWSLGHLAGKGTAWRRRLPAAEAAWSPEGEELWKKGSSYGGLETSCQVLCRGAASPKAGMEQNHTSGVRHPWDAEKALSPLLFCCCSTTPEP